MTTGVVLQLFSSQFPLVATHLCEARLRQFLPLSENYKRDHRIPRCALLHPDGSPFRRLYLSAKDQSLITFTGLDHHTFNYLLQNYTPLYNLNIVLQNAGTRGGRPRSLHPAGCLALLLGHTRTRGSISMLQMFFGHTNSVLSVFLYFSMRLLFRVLKDEQYTEVEIPSCDEINADKEKIVANFLDLDGI
jgi:hypothetical protein